MATTKTIQQLAATSVPVVGTDLLPLARGVSPMTSATVFDLIGAMAEVSAANIAALQAFPAGVGDTVYVGRNAATAGDGYGGPFAWITGNQSASVTADTTKALWIAPSSDTTGASGAYNRIFTGEADARWAGAAANGVVSGANSTAFAAIIAMGEGRPFFFPAGGVSQDYMLANQVVIAPSGADTSVRNYNWRGGGGDNNGGDNCTRLSSRVTSGAGFLFRSIIMSSFSDLVFSARVAGQESVIRLDAAANPGFSGHHNLFQRSALTVPTATGTSGPAFWVIDQKLTKISQVSIPANPGSGIGLRYGADPADIYIDPNTGLPAITQQGGQAGRALVEQLFIDSDIDIRNAANLRFTELNLTTGGRVTKSGGSYGSVIQFVNGCITETASGASLTTSNSTTASYLSSDSGCWLIDGMIFREQALAIDIYCPTTVRGSQFACRRLDDIAINIRAGVDQVFIANDNDFRQAFRAGQVPIVDNRTGALTDQFICDQFVAANTALSAVGAWTNVINVSTHRPYRGGKASGRSNICLLNNDAATQTFGGRILFDGVEIDLGTISVPAGGYGIIPLGKAIRKAALTRATPVGTATANSTVQVQVLQSAGVAATILGASGSTGRTWVQIKEVA